MKRKEWRKRFLDHLTKLIQTEDGCSEEDASKLALDYLEAAGLDVCMEGFEGDPEGSATIAPSDWADLKDD